MVQPHGPITDWVLSPCGVFQLLCNTSFRYDQTEKPLWTCKRCLTSRRAFVFTRSEKSVVNKKNKKKTKTFLAISIGRWIIALLPDMQQRKPKSQMYWKSNVYKFFTSLGWPLSVQQYKKEFLQRTLLSSLQLWCDSTFPHSLKGNIQNSQIVINFKPEILWALSLRLQTFNISYLSLHLKSCVSMWCANKKENMWRDPGMWRSQECWRCPFAFYEM